AVGAAGLLNGWVFSIFSAFTGFDQASFPFARLYARHSNFPSEKVERKIRSPHIQGEEWPGGTSLAQSGLSLLKTIGGRADAATPWPVGPRNCGQNSWLAAAQLLERASQKKPSSGIHSRV